MADIWVCKSIDGTIRPHMESDAEALKRFKFGEPFKIKAVKPRNGQHHRLGMGMLQWVFDNQDRFDVFEDFLVEIKLRTGHYREHLTLRGVIIYVPKSIAFENMDEIEFGIWRQKAIDCVLKHFMPDMSAPEFESALSRVLGYV